MNAVISNKEHSDYGVMTIPLPIPNDQYDRIMDMLGNIGIGDVTGRDCHIDEIIGGPSILRKLTGALVNLDELDYLAKRLDSFSSKEMAAYQGMVVKHGYTDMTDLINLTFSCDNVTVITDFSDMEAIGRNHVLAQHTAMAVEELEAMDLAGIGQALVRSGKGTVTPYGVVYDEDFRLEQAYTGASFPAYHYQDSLMDIELYSPYSKVAEAFLSLPAPSQQISRTLQRAGFAEENSYTLTIADHALSSPTIGSLDLNHESLSDLNRLLTVIDALEQKQRADLDAVVLYAHPKGAEQVKNLAGNLELFEVIPNVWDAEAYGRYMIIESGHIDYDADLENYIDFESYGQDRMRWQEGQFTELGYVGYCGNESLKMLMADKPQQTVSQQMGVC